MANEITIASWISGTSGSSFATSAASNTTYRADQTGTHKLGQTQEIGTTDEALDFGDVTAGSNSLGFYHVTNLDPANKVYLSLATGGSFDTYKFAEVLPGKTFGPCYSPVDTIYAKADTAACIVYVTAFQR